MLLEKIQHHLGLAFLVLLIIAQGLLFLGARASIDARDNLQALFINPSESSNIEKGFLLDFEAQLYIPEQDTIDQVYFTIVQTDLDISGNFTAYLTEEDTWRANIPWDTNNWPAGNYQISATANIFDEHGVVIEIYNSEAQNFYLIEPVEYEAAQFTGDLFQITEPAASTSIAIGTNLPVSAISEGELNVDNRAVVFEIIDPTLAGSGVISEVRVDIFNDNNPATRVWSTSLETSELNPGREYLLTATLWDVEPGSGGELIAIVEGDEIQIFTSQSYLVPIDVTSSDPATGAVIRGSRLIRLDFDITWPANLEMLAVITHSNDDNFEYSFDDANDIEIVDNGHGAEFTWHSDAVQGDWDDPVFPDTNMEDDSDYYIIDYYSRDMGTDELRLLYSATYDVDNQLFIDPETVEPGPVHGVASLFFHFSDPLRVYSDFSASVTDYFGNDYLLSIDEHDDNTLRVFGWNTMAQNDNGELRFPDSEGSLSDLYDLQIFGIRAGTTELLRTFQYQVQNNVVQDIPFTINWHEPVDSAYLGTSIILMAQTSQPAAWVQFEVRNSADSAIGQSELEADLYNAADNIWLHSFPIPDDWPDGNYQIEMMASPEDSSEIISGDPQPLTISSQNQNNDPIVFQGGGVTFHYSTNMSGTRLIEIEPDSDWTEEEIESVDAFLIIRDLEEAEVDRFFAPLNSEGDRFATSLDTTTLENGTYKICATFEIDGQPVSENEACISDVVNIYNEQDIVEAPEEFGTLEVRFLKSYRDANLPQLHFRFETEEVLDSARVMLKHISSDRFVGGGLVAIKGEGEDYYRAFLTIPEDSSWGGYATYPPGDYAYFIKGIVDGEEKWSVKAPDEFRIPEPDDPKLGQPEEDMAGENFVPEIVLHSNQETFTTGDPIIVSTNFFKTGTAPIITFKSAKNVDKTESMGLVQGNCEGSVIPNEQKQTISASGHKHCWWKKFPAKSRSEEVGMDTSFSVNGPGRMLFRYAFENEDGEGLSAETTSGAVNFVFTIKEDAPNVSTVDIIHEPGIKDGVIEVDLDSAGPISKNSISFAGEIDCIDFDIYNDNTCNHFKALLNDQISAQCLAAQIYTEDECEYYLLQKRVKLECESEDIVDPAACQDFLLEKYVSTVECALDNLEQCTSILREKYLSRLAVARDQQIKISSSTVDLIGEILPLDELSSRLVKEEIDPSVLPLEVKKEIKVLLAKSNEQTVLETENQLTVLHSAVMIIDTDADGLADDVESYYNTDPNNPDTDGDGYLDGEEVANGYNPMGEGKLEQERTTLEKIISSSSNIEQPKKFSKKIDNNFEIKLLENEEKNIRLEGKAKANTWVNIFLYSDLPLVMTTKTDESGNWTYDLQHSLVDGGHKVYVTVNDDTGSIVKQSNPLAFLVRSAQAVTADQYFDAGNTNIDNATDSMMWLYVSGAILLLVFGIIFIIILHRNKNSQV